MNRFVLAAGLLSVAPLTDLMVWLNPPPEVITIEERSIYYTPKDSQAMESLLAEVDEDLARRDVLADLFNTQPERN